LDPLKLFIYFKAKHEEIVIYRFSIIVLVVKKMLLSFIIREHQTKNLNLISIKGFRVFQKGNMVWFTFIALAYENYNMSSKLN